MSSWESYLAENYDRLLAELADFLRIPSISSLPEHADDVMKAAVWVQQRLQTAGIENVEILPTAGHPVVYGDWLHAPGKPTVLIYGHFDVQPVDPVDLWHSPPFEPVITPAHIIARGATDDKGNMFAPIIAVEALLQSNGSLPLNLKFIFEGQEEIGSPNLPDFLAQHKERFAADLVISADGAQWSEEEPLLLVGLKGLCGVQIDVKGANSDLHSGIYGGAVQNPLSALVQILASMRGADGKILVAGFYDRVRPFTADDRARIAAVPFDEAQYKADLGVAALFGEPGFTTLERAWARPTLELNGIWGGFQGDGVKTVLPNAAHAKITCRLVADQSPAGIAKLIAGHVEKHTPPGVSTTVTIQPTKADPYLMPADHPGNKVAHAVLEELYGRTPYYTRTGGSVPVYSLFQKLLAAYTVTFAFGLEDENLHAPNEYFRLSSFKLAQRAYCKLLARLAEAEL